MACICEFPDDCGGSGFLTCEGCGGDLCVCPCGGEMTCEGCAYCDGESNEEYSNEEYTGHMQKFEVGQRVRICNLAAIARDIRGMTATIKEFCGTEYVWVRTDSDLPARYGKPRREILLQTIEIEPLQEDAE